MDSLLANRNFFFLLDGERSKHKGSHAYSSHSEQ